MSTEAQILSREMILPAYKAAISPGPPLEQTAYPAQLTNNLQPFYAKQSQFPQRQNERKLICHKGLWE